MPRFSCQHLENIFKPNSQTRSFSDVKMLEFLDTPCQMSLSINHFSPNEVKLEITKLGNNKTPEHDRIEFKLI